MLRMPLEWQASRRIGDATAPRSLDCQSRKQPVPELQNGRSCSRTPGIPASPRKRIHVALRLSSLRPVREWTVALP